MQVALKIWRYDPVAGERALKEYEVSAPEEATLLDVLDIVKDQVDGSLAYRKSCRMMICGSCGMRMDGAAVLACKIRMYDVAQEGRVPVISAMGNLPVVKDLVVDMAPFWGKIRAVTPWLEPGYSDPGETEHVVSQERMDVIHKESLCIMCGCCVSECNSMDLTIGSDHGWQLAGTDRGSDRKVDPRNRTSKVFHHENGHIEGTPNERAPGRGVAGHGEEVQGAGAEVVVETGAGDGASIPDKAFADAGAEIAPDAASTYADADVVLKVRHPMTAAEGNDELALMKRGAVLIGILNPHGNRDMLPTYAEAGVTALAMELVPRITRAQSMDVLSSQANLAGIPGGAGRRVGVRAGVSDDDDGGRHGPAGAGADHGRRRRRLAGDRDRQAAGRGGFRDRCPAGGEGAGPVAGRHLRRGRG